MSMRILATADLHLGLRFSGYPEVQAELSEARFLTLQRLVEKANAERCNLFLVAGDLFERVNLPQREIMRAADLLAEFQGDLVAVLPGNHDFHPGGTSTLWNSFRERGGDRLLVLNEPRCYDLKHYGLDVRLYPGPCRAKHSAEHALSWLSSANKSLKETDGDVLHLGVAHGSVEGISPDEQGEYFPMKRSDLEALGLDLWIVGHSHSQHPPAGTEPDLLLIPGTPEPDGFDCRHGGTAWLLTVDGRRRIQRLSLATGSYRFRREELDLQDGCDVTRLFSAYRSPEYARTLLRLALKGSLSRETLDLLRQEIKDLEGSLFWVQIDDSEVAQMITAVQVETEFSRDSFPYLLLRKLIEEQDPEALQVAYSLIQEARS